jgi:peptidoglycan/LPS O-acetylase OafA/YrhL
MISNTVSAHGWSDFFRNVFFLQGVTGPTYGSDSALWSLSYEFWYYVLFPLGLFAVLRSTKMFPRIISLTGLVAVAWFVRGPILEYFPVWLLGTVLALVKPPQLGIKGRTLIAALYIPVYLFFAKAQVAMPAFSRYVSPTQQDYLLGVATAFFLWAMLSAREKAEPSWATNGATELSRFSYTLYVVHIPVLVVLAACIVGDTRWQPNAITCLYALAILVLITGYAYGVAWLTEFRTDKLRKMIERNLFGRTEAPRRA